MLQLKSQGSESKNVWLLYYHNFERNYDVLKLKSPCIFLNKSINFDKNGKESKIENPTQGFRDINLVLQLIQESQIKSKTVMSWSWRKKKRTFFVLFFVWRNVLSQFVVYWIHFQIINTFTYQKTLLHALLLFVLKIV